MYEKAVVAMAKQSVTLEVLSYHASASMDDAGRLKVSIIIKDCFYFIYFLFFLFFLANKIYFFY